MRKTGALSRPAFANVNISSQYDKESRELRIHVSGSRNEDLIPVEGQANLTVFLTEDEVMCEKWSETDNEILDDILRQRLTDIWGDPVAWNNDNYGMDYLTTLPENWNPSKMHIIAFLSKPFTGSNFDDMDVLNCNMATLGGNSSSDIESITLDAPHSSPTPVYNLQGQLVSNDIRHLSNLPRGIYIINGKKVLRQ